jgi:two-component system chemotaxis response regulator CheY
MQTATAELLKLKPVLDLGAAEEFLLAVRQKLESADQLRLDASAVKSITTPCIQVILSAVKTGDDVSVISPSEEFVRAFADLGVTFPEGQAIETPPPAPVEQLHDPMPIEMAPADTPPLDPATPEMPDPAQHEAPAMAKRILTIDDSKTIRDMLRMTLVDAGFEVLQAVDGQDGVDVMTREQVDLVITDINMPKMNGYEVVRHLRSNPAFKGLPILVLTTESDTDKKNLAREAGATGWMVKPFDPDRLVATVRKVLP